MHKRSRFLSSLFLAAALTFSVMGTACAHHYRVYDPYYSDYHVWDNVEVGYYHQWARDNQPRRAPRLPQSAAWRTEGILDLAAQPRRSRPSLDLDTFPSLSAGERFDPLVCFRLLSNSCKTLGLPGCDPRFASSAHH